MAIDPPAVEAIGVSKRYGNRDALRGVDLVARPGRLHGLLGPNGAGKTTLMRVVLGLVRLDGGTITLFGHRVSSMGGSLPNRVAGFVETPAFYPYLSGRTNLDLVARLDDDESAGRRERIDRALEDVGLTVQAGVAVGGYSAGMRQRLGLAAALLRSPRLLILDEPTSSLDPAGARDVRALAKRIADGGAAVLLSSHDMDEVEELCSDLTVINHGRVVFAGTIEQFRSLAPPPAHALRTSDDAAALALASGRAGLQVSQGADGGLDVSASTDALDAYVIALAHAGVAVRVLEHRAPSFESLFLELTGAGSRERGAGSREQGAGSGE
jgi:ABC-2 type transport system ATP-binding protein